MPPILIFLGAVVAIHSPYIAIWFAQRRWLGVRSRTNYVTVACVIAEFIVGMTLIRTL